MVNGIEKRDGTILDKGTGLAKDSVARATKSLVEKGILTRRRVTSPERGCQASEYSLKVIHTPLSENHDRGPVPKIGQGVVRKSDTQDTLKQNIEKTFRNVSNKEETKKPVDKSINQKHDYLVDLILQTCRDQHSLAFYRKIAKLLPEQAIFETLSEVREAIQLGRIRVSSGAMFTDLIKRKAKELGPELGAELRNEHEESEPRHEKLQEPTEFSTPAKVMIGKELGVR